MTTTQCRGVAVVTGGSAGVGRAVVRRLAEEGFDIGILARGEAGLAGATGDVEARGRRALAVPVDVGDAAAVDDAAAQVEADLGPIDVWVNNAMTTVFAWSWDIEPEEYRRATEVTYLGQVYGTLAALRRMKPRNRGRIVNVGSSLAYIGIPLQAAYCASKFAARGFSESVRAELLHQGSEVTLSMVHLPAINTPQFEWSEARLPNHPQPVPPIYSPEVAAHHIVAAVFDGRRSKMLGAWNKLIFAGIKAAPAVLAHFTARTGVSSQQTGERVHPDRPSNLWKPVDAEEDHGAHGSFAAHEGGFLNPRFLATLPKAAADVAVAGAGAARFRLQRRARSKQLRDRSRVGSPSPSHDSGLGPS